MNLKCGGCGAELVVEEHLRTAQCPYCASPQVIERAASDHPPPRFALGFQVPREDAEARLRHWLRRRSWYAPSGLKRATLKELKGVYVPAYLFSAVARSSYRAEIGENYTVTTGTGKNRRTETRTEWRSLDGWFHGYVNDILVTASRGVDNDDLERIEPFDLRLLKRYSPALVSGWIAEEATIEEEGCRKLALAEAYEQIERRIEAFLPGDKHQSLSHDTKLERESQIGMLLPLWIAAFSYDEGKPPLRIFCNGQSAKVAGRVPVSWPKVALAVLFVLALVALGALFATRPELLDRLTSGGRR